MKRRRPGAGVGLEPVGAAEDRHHHRVPLGRVRELGLHPIRDAKLHNLVWDIISQIQLRPRDKIDRRGVADLDQAIQGPDRIELANQSRELVAGLRCRCWCHALLLSSTYAPKCAGPLATYGRRTTIKED